MAKDKKPKPAKKTAKVGRIGTRRRDGCKPHSRLKGIYVCTEKAVAMQAAGKNRIEGRKAPKGHRFVSMKQAINPLSKRFKTGCYWFKNAPVCKSAPRKVRKSKAA